MICVTAEYLTDKSPAHRTKQASRTFGHKKQTINGYTALLTLKHHEHTSQTESTNYSNMHESHSHTFTLTRHTYKHKINGVTVKYPTDKSL